MHRTMNTVPTMAFTSKISLSLSTVIPIRKEDAYELYAARHRPSLAGGTPGTPLFPSGAGLRRIRWRAAAIPGDGADQTVPATVQNWVKRGWVSAPVNKRYGERQVARILLINLLRPAMRLDQIASLLRYVNGSVDDRTDDILPDDQLYNWLCTATLRLREESALNHEFVTTLIEALLEGYEGPVPDAKERLSHALTIMLLNVAAAALMQEADALMAREVSPDESPVPRNHGSSPAKNKRKV